MSLNLITVNVTECSIRKQWVNYITGDDGLISLFVNVLLLHGIENIHQAYHAGITLKSLIPAAGNIDPQVAILRR